MPSVKVRLFQELRLAAGVSETRVEAASVSSALQALVLKYGDQLRDLVFDEKGSLRNYLQVYLNNRHVPNPLGFSSELKEGDLLLLIPPIGGGYGADQRGIFKFDLFIPKDSKNLLKFLDRNGQGYTIIAHGSDLVNRIRRGHVKANILVDISGIREWSYIGSEEGRIRIGALTTVTELLENPLLSSKYPVFQQVANKFGAPNILNLATVGGNICAASSAEDLLPVFLVLDAKVRLKGLRGERISRLEDFIVDKRVIDLEPGEILTEVFFDELREDEACAYDKVGWRKSLILALVNIAIFLQLNKDTETIRNIRVGLNRLKGKIPERAKLTELKLTGRKLDEEAIQEGIQTLSSELRVKSDFRASGEYRLEAAKTLFRRVLLQCAENILTR